LQHLPPEDFCVLNPGAPEPGGTRALLAAGTGLGQSILVWDGGRYRVVPSEGGHSDFAPHTEQQIELLALHAAPLSAGQPGNSFFRPRPSAPFMNFSHRKLLTLRLKMPDADPAPEITGVDGQSCRVCSDALDL